MNARLLCTLAIAWVTLPFVAVGQVSISGFTPAYGAPGDMVTISGNGFYPGTVEVRFNGTKSLYAGATSSTIIQAQVPSGATTGPISVKIGSGPAVNSLLDFTVIGNGPYIAGFTIDPPYVYIDGAHFSTVTNAYFDGKKASEFFVQSDIRIRVIPPSNVTTGPLSVRSPLGNSTSADLYYVPPVLKSFSPASGRTGNEVIILGTNFLGTLAVKFNGTNAAFTVLSNLALRATVPPLARTGKLRVDAPAGSETTSGNFVVLPTVYGFSPGFGAPGSLVVVTGANFNVGTPVVRFNGAQAVVGNLTFSNLTAAVPNSATTGPISIQTTDGTHTSTNVFYVSPVLTSFTPNNGVPGTTVTITGNNFTGASAVTFGETPAASFTVSNNTTIGAVVPGGVSTGPIGVTTPAGTVSSATLFYGFPVITSFSPTHGLPGTNVLILGTNLLGITAVRFNGVDAQVFTADNNSFINAIVPAGAQAGPISVVSPAGTNFSSQNFVLDYVDLGLSVDITPSYLFAGSNSFWVFTITNRGPAEAPNARFTNQVPAGVVLVSASSSQGTLSTDDGRIIANLGTLPANAEATVTQQLQPTVVGDLTIRAGATSGYLETAPSDNELVATAFVYPPALMSIKLLTNQVRISWPASLSNFVLQHKFNLNPTNSWMNTPAHKTTTPTENVVVDTNNVSQKFYRLRSGS